MSTRIRIAFVCYFLAGLLASALAAVFLALGESIPYHEVIGEINWFNPGEMKLLNISGGLGLAAAIALLFLLFMLFRTGARWALWSISLIGLFGYALMFYAMSLVALSELAGLLWPVGIAGTTLVIAAFALSIPVPAKWHSG